MKKTENSDTFSNGKHKHLTTQLQVLTMHMFISLLLDMTYYFTTRFAKSIHQPFILNQNTQNTENGAYNTLERIRDSLSRH